MSLPAITEDQSYLFEAHDERIKAWLRKLSLCLTGCGALAVATHYLCHFVILRDGAGEEFYQILIAIFKTLAGCLFVAWILLPRLLAKFQVIIGTNWLAGPQLINGLTFLIDLFLRQGNVTFFSDIRRVTLYIHGGRITGAAVFGQGNVLTPMLFLEHPEVAVGILYDNCPESVEWQKGRFFPCKMTRTDVKNLLIRKTESYSPPVLPLKKAN